MNILYTEQGGVHMRPECISAPVDGKATWSVILLSSKQEKNGVCDYFCL